MSPYRRNVIVGATVLVAMLILGWMILKFGGGMASPFAPEQIPVTFTTARADGVSDGSAILYRGVESGRVVRLTLSPDQKSVTINALINQHPALPGNVIGVIRNQSLLGTGAAIVLELKDTEPSGVIQRGQMIEARFVGLEVLPPEFADLATELRATVRQFRDSNLVNHIDAEVRRAGELIESLKKWTDDPALRQDLEKTLANVRTATETANRVAANLESFSQKLEKLSDETTVTVTQARTTITRSEEQVMSLSTQVGQRLQQTAVLLEQFQSIAAKIDNGQGTAGQLVNDKRLYESLVDTSRELNATIKDLKRLVEQWEQEGISFKLK